MIFLMAKRFSSVFESDIIKQKSSEIKEDEREIKRRAAERMSPTPFVLSVTAFVLLSSCGYEGVMFPVDN